MKNLDFLHIDLYLDFVKLETDAFVAQLSKLVSSLLVSSFMNQDRIRRVEPVETLGYKEI